MHAAGPVGAGNARISPGPVASLTEGVTGQPDACNIRASKTPLTTKQEKVSLPKNELCQATRHARRHSDRADGPWLWGDRGLRH